MRAGGTATSARLIRFTLARMCQSSGYFRLPGLSPLPVFETTELFKPFDPNTRSALAQHAEGSWTPSCLDGTRRPCGLSIEPDPLVNQQQQQHYHLPPLFSNTPTPTQLTRLSLRKPGCRQLWHCVGELCDGLSLTAATLPTGSGGVQNFGL